MGQHKPNFIGMPEDHYEIPNSEIALAVFACASFVVLWSFVCVGFFFWTSNAGTSSFALAWSIVLIVFILFFMIAAYMGSRNKH